MGLFLVLATAALLVFNQERHTQRLDQINASAARAQA